MREIAPNRFRQPGNIALGYYLVGSENETAIESLAEFIYKTLQLGVFLLAAVLVGFHVVGSTLVWSTALWFHHGLSDHLPWAADAGGSPGGDGSRTVPTASDQVPEPA